MMKPIRVVVQLSSGTVTLQAWGEDVAEMHAVDILRISSTLLHAAEEWEEYERGDIDARLWASFWRVVNASLYRCDLPRPVSWGDRLTLLLALMDLNDMGEPDDPKWIALRERTLREIARQLPQGLTTAPGMNS